MLSTVRHAPDRWLHASRRARAIARLHAVAGLERVLVVCHGNICRSPYAATLLRRALDPYGVAVESAGFVGPGRPVPVAAYTTGMRHGEDLTAHRSQLLDPALMRGAQVIVVMDTVQRARLRRDHGAPEATIVLLGDLDPWPITKRAVRDPYAQALPVFEEVFVRIDRCVAVLAAALVSAVVASSMAADAASRVASDATLRVAVTPARSPATGAQPGAAREA